MIKRVLITILLTGSLTSCATVETKAQKVAEDYCARDELSRQAIRKKINVMIHPHRIELTCEMAIN